MLGPILCGFDGTPASLAAIAFGARLAAASKSRLTAVTVEGTWPASEGRPLAPMPATAAGIGVHRWYVSARSPGLGLHDVARLTHAWLLVLGRPPGPRGARIHQALVNGAPCAVAVVPQKEPPEPGPVGVAWDGTPEGEAAIAFGTRLARLLGVGVEILHAPHDAPPPVAGIQARLLEGRPDAALLAASAGLSALVAGARARQAPGTLSLGAVSGELVDAAACPIVVLPGEAVAEALPSLAA
jgi:nucleotide-binding universal stress UspA family protein